MIKYSVTYATITDESASNGDFAETGFEIEDKEISVDDIVHLIVTGFTDPSSWPLRAGGLSGVWLSNEFEQDIYSGEQTQQSLHIDASEAELEIIFKRAELI
jgi:hypothetical protein